MKKILSTLNGQYDRFSLNRAVFRKVILQGCFSLSLLLLAPALVLAKTGTYNNGVPSGWFWDTGVYSFDKSLHAGSGFSSGNTLNFVNGNLTNGGTNSGRGSIFGGWSRNGNVGYNTVNISGGTVNSVFGGWTHRGTAAGNTVRATGGTIKGYSFAGTSEYGDAVANTFHLSDGTFLSYVFAGQTQSGNAIDNTFYMSGGEAVHITGGRSHSGDVLNNSVFMTNGQVKGVAAAARSNGTAHLEGNQITISGGIVDSYTTGAYVKYGTATGNRVNISGGTFKGSIYGADSTSGTLNNNGVYLTSAPTLTAGNTIYGATSQRGTVTGNLVDIRGSVNILDNTVAGAYSGNNFVQNNSVVIAGAAVSTTGGKIYGGQTLTGTVSNNSVYINTTGDLKGSSISGANSTSGAVSGNIVTIDAVTSAGHISGGSSDSGTVDGNLVTINGGTFTGAISGGDSTSGDVSNNTVTITDGTFTGVKVTGGHSESGSVTDNHVIIDGGSFSGTTTITAGSVHSTATGSAYGNTLTIEDASGIEDTVILSGAVTDTTDRTIGSAHNPLLRSGNTLVLKDNTVVKHVVNFEHYELHMANSHDTNPMLQSDNLHLGEDANLRVYLGNKADNLQDGEKIIVFKQTGVARAAISGNVGSAVALQGLSVVNHLVYGGHATNIHYFTIAGQSAHPHSITFSEARLASFAFMNKSDDLILGQGIASALDAAAKNPNAWEVFSAVSMGTSGYDTESGTTTGDIEFGGLSFVAGASKLMPVGNAELLTGAYIEAGTGFINTDNNNNNQSAVNTAGDSNYYGLGLLSRYTMGNGIYGEAFIRGGMLDMDNHTRDNKYDMKFDTSSLYYGAGVSFGYQLPLFANRDMLDIYGRYTWTHLTSQEEHLDSQNYEFDAINSHQARVGAQYNFMPANTFTPYVGVAAQYEFGGEAGATIRGTLDTLRPDITGFTGVAELGFRVLPSENMPITTTMNLEGYLGEREGVSLTLDIAYYF